MYVGFYVVFHAVARAPAQCQQNQSLVLPVIADRNFICSNQERFEKHIVKFNYYCK